MFKQSGRGENPGEMKDLDMASSLHVFGLVTSPIDSLILKSIFWYNVPKSDNTQV